MMAVVPRELALKFFEGIPIEAVPDNNLQQKGEAITTLFDHGVFSLLDPSSMPNPHLNKIACYMWRMVENKVTPTALAEVGRMHFGATMPAYGQDNLLVSERRSIIYVPLKWDEMCAKDRWMQLGALVFTASMVCDFGHRRMSKTSEVVRDRAMAHEAEYLLVLLDTHRLRFHPNEYQKHVLDKYPRGLASLDSSIRYTPDELVAGDWEKLWRGEAPVVPARPLVQGSTLFRK